MFRACNNLARFRNTWGGRTKAKNESRRLFFLTRFLPSCTVVKGQTAHQALWMQRDVYTFLASRLPVETVNFLVPATLPAPSMPFPTRHTPRCKLRHFAVRCCLDIFETMTERGFHCCDGAITRDLIWRHLYLNFGLKNSRFACDFFT